MIQRRAQAAALVSPVRQEIVDAVAAADGPCTVAQIAAWLGRRPDALYYHVTALVRAGLLVESGSVRAGTRFGAIYDVPGRPLRLNPRGEIGAQALARVMQAALRLADRDFRRALEHGDAIVEGPHRNLRGGRCKGWIADEDLSEINALFERLLSLMHNTRPRPGARAFAFTYAFVPVEAQHASAPPALPSPTPPAAPPKKSRTSPRGHSKRRSHTGA